MPHVSERQPGEDDLKRREKTEGPEGQPRGVLDGQPINADETAPRETVPDPPGAEQPVRHPEAVDDEPGSDL